MLARECVYKTRECLVALLMDIWKFKSEVEAQLNFKNFCGHKDDS